MDSTSFFETHPVFTLDDLSRGLGALNGKRSAKERVKYHLAQGRLKLLARGVYATVPPGVDPSGFQPDPYLVAAAVRPDALFSHHAALELLGAAHSVWQLCTFYTARRRQPLKVGMVELRFLNHPPVLVRQGLVDLGTRQVDRRGRWLRVTGPERTLVDGFRQPHLAGGLTELVESAAGLGVLDLDLLSTVLEAYRQKALWAAVGWFLETYRQTFFVPDDYLVLLERHRPRSPHYLPRHERGRGGVLVPRWNLILPDSLVRGAEPNES